MTDERKAWRLDEWNGWFAAGPAMTHAEEKAAIAFLRSHAYPKP